MPVIVVGTEKNFAALRSRLFTRSVSSKTAGEVSAALQAANPHADLKALAPGTVLVVPDDLPHVSVRGDLSLDGGTTGSVADVLTAGETSVSDLVTTVRGRVRAGTTARKKLAQTLAGEQVRAAAAKDKAIAGSLKAAQEALAAGEAADRAAAEALAGAQSDWSADLAALRKTLPA